MIHGVDFELVRIVALAAEATGVDPALLAGIVTQESGWNPLADGDFEPREDGPDEKDGVRGEYWSHGLGGLHRRGAGGSVSREQLYDPTVNAYLAGTYLRQCVEGWPNERGAAISAYNAGMGYTLEHGWRWNQDRYVLPALASTRAWEEPMRQARVLMHLDAVWGNLAEIERVTRSTRIRQALWRCRGEIGRVKAAVGIE